MARPSRSEFDAKIRRLLDRLRSDIREGRLQHGDYLPSEVELGRRYGLSKESVRKALDRLVGEGLIVKIRRVGNRVDRPEPGAGTESSETAGDTGNGNDATNLGRGDFGQAEAVRGREAGRERGSGTMADGSRAAGAAERDRVLVRVAYYPSLREEAMMERAAAAFEAAHPGIAVKLMPTPFPLDYAEHCMADVIALTAWDALKMRERDPALPLLANAPPTDYANALLAEPFRTPQGRMAAAPYVHSPVVLCYNREHFAASSLKEPEEGWTWYTLLKSARTLAKRSGVCPFAAHMQSVNRWPVFLLQNGFRFGTENGRRASENPAFWESLRVARDLVRSQESSVRLWTENDADVERWFREERTSMIMTTYYGLNRLSGTNLDYGVTPLPALRTDATLLLATGLAVVRQAAWPEAARSFVRYLCGEAWQTELRRRTLTLPAHPGAMAVRQELEGNRPSRDPDGSAWWDRCKLYSDLQLGTEELEAVREELKAYWSMLEDEAEASERLELLFVGKDE
ncbi:extracellular solute-binding protein [Paenibacillus flagellatus]|uniref:HTH gntR-type domain-containing protein n=1 Tax=Paenibacillus flagellatus TaxID=2211139 RepID=A0A2V5K171_9BACL|nr:extracellular solute-binding protein [Paenibacillus flagellatus]PYI52868.1 hypothetical protein DLM86_17820 [Paenibacillus flagellatus]